MEGCLVSIMSDEVIKLVEVITDSFFTKSSKLFTEVGVIVLEREIFLKHTFREIRAAIVADFRVFEESHFRYCECFSFKFVVVKLWTESQVVFFSQVIRESEVLMIESHKVSSPR